jgi:hypothetical protein
MKSKYEKKKSINKIVFQDYSYPPISFFPYLCDSLFTIVTDHITLEYLVSKHESTSRLTRWAIYFQQFDMEIKYWPGKLNPMLMRLTAYRYT